MNFEAQNYPREFDFAEIFGIAKNIYTSNYTQIFKMEFYIAFPLNILLIVLFPIGVPEINPETFQITGLNYLNFLINVVLGFFSLISLASVQLYIHNKISNPEFEQGIVDTFKSAFHYFPRMIVSYLAYTGLVVLGSIFFLIPGIYFALIFGFSLFAIVIRDMSISNAFDYSNQLSKGRRMYVLSMFLFLLLLMIIMQIVGGVVMQILQDKIYQAVIATLINVISAYFYVFLYVLFINLEDTIHFRNPNYFRMNENQI